MSLFEPRISDLRVGIPLTMKHEPSAKRPSVTLHLIRSPSNLGHYVRDSTWAPPIPSSLPLSTVIDDVQIHQHPKGKYSKNNQRAPTPRATIYQRCLGHAVRVGDEPPALRGLVRGQRDDKDWREGEGRRYISIVVALAVSEIKVYIHSYPPVRSSLFLPPSYSSYTYIHYSLSTYLRS